MTDTDLIDMGIVAKGDRLKLKAFCESKNQSNEDERALKKRKLKEILEAGKLLRQPTPASKGKQQNTPKAGKKQTLKFEIRWKHFNEDSGYKAKRIEQGGGVRTIHMKKDASALECLEEIKNIFFPEDETRDKLEFQLADFMSKPIDLSDKFSPEEYKSRYNLHTPRLFLLTKERHIETSSEESDSELMKPAFSPIFNEEHECLVDAMHDSATFVPISDDTCSLIGSSEERITLMDEQMAEYNASLNADREKETQSALEESRKENIRKSRESRVTNEPSECSPYVAVSVRHPSFGIIRRRFPPDCKVTAVYDWVGSLATTPEDFSLSLSHPRIKIHPDDNISLISSSVLYMSEVEHYLIPHEDVTSKSKEQEEATSFDQQEIEDNHPDDHPIVGIVDLENISPAPPMQLFEDDDDFVDDNRPRGQFNSLTDKRKRAAESFNAQEYNVYEVDRHNCFKNLLSLYKNDSITKQKLSLRFKNEDAAGDGVTREVYSVFWNSFLTTFCEGSSQYIFFVSASLSSDDYVVLGRIITHQFLLTDTFPVQLSEAAVQQAVVGRVTEECLISSFLMLLPEKERNVVQCALSPEEPFPISELIEILSDYGVQRCVTKDNVKDILIQVSTTEMISKPFFCLNKLQEGMGPFWKAVTGAEISALYMLCSPTNKNVIESLQLDGESQQEVRVFQWLIRYLRNKDQQTVARFLRFCTGSDVILPHSSIKIRMENMSALSMRPKAQTCFRVLVIPKNYPTQARLRDNMDFYLSNPQLWDLAD